MKKFAAANSAKRAIREAEIALDEALTRASTMMARLPELRRQAGLSATVGQVVLRHTGDTIAALVTAQSSMSLAHNALEAVRLDHHIPITAAGPDEDKPPPGVTQDLAVVANAA
ncbi:MAG: hypothetical protein BGN86_01800 [Caulobacterales bacterium 68-7]|nr:hypothetical protein [Caulobacterales bacterium]OJU09676.1 MAG: hypothetical protein BGN86_01800 [Caulobacterales bacterium 68-7]